MKVATMTEGTFSTQTGFLTQANRSRRPPCSLDRIAGCGLDSEREGCSRTWPRSSRYSLQILHLGKTERCLYVELLPRLDVKFDRSTYIAVLLGSEAGTDIVIGAVELEVARAPAVRLIGDVVALHLPGRKVKLCKNVNEVALNISMNTGMC